MIHDFCIWTSVGCVLHEFRITASWLLSNHNRTACVKLYRLHHATAVVVVAQCVMQHLFCRIAATLQPCLSQAIVSIGQVLHPQDS